MEYDTIGNLSDAELGRALRGAIERSGDDGIALIIFSTNVRASIGCPALYNDARQSIPGEEMHEFANVSNALVSLGHAPRQSVEVRRDFPDPSVMMMLSSFESREGSAN
jgi:hypothetical protein